MRKYGVVLAVLCVALLCTAAVTMIDLTTQVKGILPTANGGTGSAFFAISGPTAARTYTLPDANATIQTNAADITIADGGTGAGTAAAARTNLGVDTETRSFVIFDPVTTDSGRQQFELPWAATVTRVYCSVKAATSVTINLDKRAEATPDTAGTNVLSAGLVCDTNGQTSCSAGCDVATISSASVTTRSPVALTISALTGTPDTLRVTVEFTH